MKKNKKLALIGLFAFLLTLLWVLNWTNFTPKRGTVSLAPINKKIFLDDNGFNVTEIRVPKDSLLVLKITNVSNKRHVIISLGQTEDQNFTLTHTPYIIEPNASIQKKIMVTEKINGHGNKIPFYYKFLLSCVSCTGNSRLDIIME
jgi:hypothetical protein